MSTNIDNAFKLNLSNFLKVDKKNNEIRKYLSIFVQQKYIEYCASMSTIAIDFYLNDKIPFEVVNILYPKKDVKPLTFHSFLSYNRTFDRKNVDLFVVDNKHTNNDLYLAKSKYKNNFNTLLTSYIKDFLQEKFNIKVNFMIHGKNTYYILNLGKNIENSFDTNKFIDDLKLEDFHYQNHSDKPEDIPNKKWKLRNHVWDQIFKNTGSINDVMYSFEIKIEQTYIDVMEDLIQYIPELEQRLKFVYGKFCIYNYFTEHKINPNKLTISEFMDVFDEIELIKTKGILEGLHFSEKYKDLLMPKEKMLPYLKNNLFDIS